MKGPHECVLSHVPRLLTVVQHLLGQTPHPLTVFLDQGLEGRGISGDAPPDQLALVDSGGRGEPGSTGGAGRRFGRHHRRTRPWPSRPLFDSEWDGRKGTRIHGRRCGAARRPPRVAGEPGRSPSPPSTYPSRPNPHICPPSPPTP